jgi:hypothetical protein
MKFLYTSAGSGKDGVNVKKNGGCNFHLFEPVIRRISCLFLSYRHIEKAAGIFVPTSGSGHPQIYVIIICWKKMYFVVHQI